MHQVICGPLIQIGKYGLFDCSPSLSLMGKEAARLANSNDPIFEKHVLLTFGQKGCKRDIEA
jgi:hypothetical protein